jgi:Mn2+/Fe2+ NRAMP family transporter
MHFVVSSSLLVMSICTGYAFATSVRFWQEWAPERSLPSTAWWLLAASVLGGMASVVGFVTGRRALLRRRVTEGK